MKLIDLLNESEFDDLELGGVGSELDQDDDATMGKGYDEDPMTDQLEKIVQSQGDDIKDPVRSVKTDDGKTFNISPEQAKTLGMLARTDNVKSTIRAQFQKDIQSSVGLEDVLSDNPKQIVQNFVQKYMK